MLLIRPMEHRDLDALEMFAQMAHAGITSLPKNRQLLEKKIEASIAAMAQDIHEPGPEYYSFLLEDSEHKTSAGVSSILARSGWDSPHYLYRVEETQHSSRSKQMHLLKPVNYHPGPSELCSLYLMPDYRKGGLGRLLSFSRFLFIALHPKNFTETIIAEMRGVIHKHANSPFWEHVGRHFIDMEFTEAMDRLANQERAFITDCLPKYPIYLELIHPEALKVIGRPHPNTRPALRFLENQGFQWDKEVDIFDAGPKVIAHTQAIRTISQRKQATVGKILSREPQGEQLLISNMRRQGFRASLGRVRENPAKQEVDISKKIAQALEIDTGNIIQYVNPYPKSINSSGAAHEKQSASVH